MVSAPDEPFRRKFVSQFPMKEGIKRMKLMSTIKFLLGLAVLFSATIASHGQNYTIDWFTIDGGGGTSTEIGRAHV